MCNDLLYFIKNVQIEDEQNNTATIAIETKELLSENDKIIIILKYDDEDIKKIEIRR